MKQLGLLGKNIAYSLSKPLHEMIASLNNLSLDYQIYDVNEDELSKAIEGLKAQQYHGFNITIPYKETIIKYLDELTPEANRIGAVNTIYFKNGKVIGDNTDYAGFDYLMNKHNELEDNPKNIYILGSGGAAKTVYTWFKNHHITPTIVSRKLNLTYPFEHVISFSEYEAIKVVDLLINCTPVGTYRDNKSPIQGTNQTINMVVDLIYNPKCTKTMTFAQKSVGGMEMLIYQAIQSERIWHNQKLKEDEHTIKTMMEVLYNELNR